MPGLRSWSLLATAVAFTALAGCSCAGNDLADTGVADAGGDASGLDALVLDTPDAPGLDSPATPDAPSVCGDGTTEAGEVCDDGNTASGDGCSADCLSDESCGNTIVDDAAGELCDDGNTTSGDGCRADCLSDYTCGNGVTDLIADGAADDEVCDDGNVEGGDGCSADCQSDESCGNTIVDLDAGEVCDDGNTMDGDLCSADCRTSSLCGNGALDGAEECDDGGRAAGDGCSPDCFVEVCGNGRMDPGEPCDDGDADELDGCRSDCSFTCDADPDCDDGESCNGTETCTTPGSIDSRCAPGTSLPSGTACGAAQVCIGGACAASVCGDGVIDARTEQCDDGNLALGDGCENDCSFSCETDADCTNGDRCDGLETCDRSNPLAPVCADGADPVCAPSDACHTAACNPTAPLPGSPCVETLIDGDGDGLSSIDLGACGLDCDDTNAMVRPGMPEVCNGVDDDCSGVADEGNPGGGATCTSSLPGICAAGVFVCAGGSLMCVRSVDPMPETCDGRDENCDGTIDDGNPGGGTACSSGLPGVCGVGTRTCTGGSLVCEPNVPPGSMMETCNGVDEDCDGVVDDGSPAALCPPPADVSSTACTTGACRVAACVANRYDVNGTYPDGCECADAVVNDCATAIDLGSVPVGGSVMTTGRVPRTPAGLEGPGDWYRVTFPLTTRGPAGGAPRIRIPTFGASNLRFDVFSDCSTPATCGSGAAIAVGLYEWQFTDNQSGGSTAYSLHTRPWPTTVLVRVRPVTPSNCETYTLIVSR